MDVWYYSEEERLWIHANLVAITRSLVALIFKGNDFRWLTKDSELFTTDDEKPEVEEDDVAESVRPSTAYTPPRDDEIDYIVVFPGPTLGLELFSDEHGFGCVVGRCVSPVSIQSVARSSHIVEVNDLWLGGQEFNVIRDAVKQAAMKPPLKIKFRIQIEYIPKGARWQKLLEEALSSSEYRDDTYVGASAVSTAKRSGAAAAGLPGPRIDSGDFLEAEEKQAQPSRETDFVGSGEEVYIPHMTREQGDDLQPGDHIDHRDDVGRYLLAVVTEKHGTKLKIHYEGWNPKWDVFSDYGAEIHRFAAPKSISRQPQKKMLHVKVRDYIDINPLHRHPGWRFGQIRRVDKYSGQVQVVYKEAGAEYLYWVHLNNPEEAAPFMTKAEESLRAAKRKKDELDPDAPPPVSSGSALPPKPGRKKRGDSRAPRGPPKKSLPPRPSSQERKWNCTMCGAANDPTYSKCMHCATPRER
jgi:hypothetical protein